MSSIESFYEPALGHAGGHVVPYQFAERRKRLACEIDPDLCQAAFRAFVGKPDATLL